MTTHPFVLLVEPDAILRELIHRELKDQGCIVFNAADPGEALAFAELYPGSIDLAVTDLPTTHHQNQLFTDALRSLPPGTHAKVLHMATTVDDSHRDLTDLGQSYLPKPFDRQALLDAVLSALPIDGSNDIQPGNGDRAVFWGAARDADREVGATAR